MCNCILFSKAFFPPRPLKKSIVGQHNLGKKRIKNCPYIKRASQNSWHTKYIYIFFFCIGSSVCTGWDIQGLSIILNNNNIFKCDCEFNHLKTNNFSVNIIYSFSELSRLEDTARYAGLLLAPAKSFGLWAKKTSLCCFGPFLAIFCFQ